MFPAREMADPRDDECRRHEVVCLSLGHWDEVVRRSYCGAVVRVCVVMNFTDATVHPSKEKGSQPNGKGNGIISLFCDVERMVRNELPIRGNKVSCDILANSKKGFEIVTFAS